MILRKKINKKKDMYCTACAMLLNECKKHVMRPAAMGAYHTFMHVHRTQGRRIGGTIFIFLVGRVLTDVSSAAHN